MDCIQLDIYFDLTKYLSLPDIARLAMVCNRFNKITHSEQIWVFRCQKDNIQLNPFSDTYYNTFKRTQLVPVYYTKTDLYQRSEHTRFANLKCSDLKGTNLLFASRLLNDSILVIVDEKFEYETTICVLNGEIHHFDDEHSSSTKSLQNRLGKEPFTVLWFNGYSGKEVATTLSYAIRVVENKHTKDRVGSYVNCRTFIPHCGYEFSEIWECHDLPILPSLNIITRLNPKIKAVLLRLTKKGNCILFCNECSRDSLLFVKVVYLCLNNLVKFKTLFCGDV